MGCDMERKGCELIECWTHVVTFNFDLTHAVFGAEFENNLSVGQVAQQSHLS